MDIYLIDLKILPKKTIYKMKKPLVPKGDLRNLKADQIPY